MARAEVRAHALSVFALLFSQERLSCKMPSWIEEAAMDVSEFAYFWGSLEFPALAGGAIFFTLAQSCDHMLSAKFVRLSCTGGSRQKNCRSNLRSEFWHQRNGVLHIHTLFKCELRITCKHGTQAHLEGIGTRVRIAHKHADRQVCTCVGGIGYS